METLITSPAGIVAGLATIVGATLILQRFKVFNFLGPVMTCIILGIIGSNLNIMPFDHEVYNPFFSFGIPLTITMLLVSVNIREWARLAKDPIKAILIASFSVFVMGLVGGLLLAPSIDEGWKLAGMFVGTYSGGSSNLAAIGIGLEASPASFAAANASDYIVGMPVMLLLFSLPKLFSTSKFFKKMWPHSLSHEVLHDEGENGIFGNTSWTVEDIAVLVMAGFIINALASKLSTFVAPGIQGAVRMLLITTMALILGQFKFFNQLKGGQQLGIYISLFYLAAIGLSIDLGEFATAAPLIAVLCGIILFGSLILHGLLCRLFKIPYQYMATSITAAIVDGPTSALVASSANWTGIIGTSIVMGAMGGALGNYLGFTAAYLIKAFYGL